MCVYMLWNTHMVDAPLLELSLASGGDVFFEGEDENDNGGNGTGNDNGNDNRSFNNSRAASGYASSVASSRYTTLAVSPGAAIPNATAHAARKYISGAAPLFWLGMVLIMGIGGRCVSVGPKPKGQRASNV